MAGYHFIDQKIKKCMNDLIEKSDECDLSTCALENVGGDNLDTGKVREVIMMLI